MPEEAIIRRQGVNSFCLISIHLLQTWHAYSYRKIGKDYKVIALAKVIKLSRGGHIRLQGEKLILLDFVDFQLSTDSKLIAKVNNRSFRHYGFAYESFR